MPRHGLHNLALAASPTLLLIAAGLEAAAQSAAPPASATAAAAVASGNVTRFRIGKLEAAALFDGTIPVANDGKTFDVGRPPSEVAAVLRANGLRQDQLELDIQPLLVRAPGRTLLFDTGAGDASFARGGHLQTSLRAAGISPTQVTDIFISHAHPDHVGGLLRSGGGLAFPNATIHISAPEWVWMKSQKDEAALAAAITPKVATFAPGAAILPGLVTAVPAPGHTPGHSAFEIGSGADRLLYIGDSAHHFVVSVQKPDWKVAFDVDASLAQRSRRALLQRAANENLRLYAVHFPYPGLGRVSPSGDGFIWIKEAPGPAR